MSHRIGAAVLSSRPRLVRVLLAFGIAAVFAGLALLWGARIAINRFVYVSELGATGEPTAWAFSLALLLIAAGAIIVAGVSTHLSSRVRFFAAWTPSVSIAASSIAFVFISQVTCTKGCPLPVGATFTWQDFTHTSVAVIGFAAACFGMLQVATARDHPGLARLSLVSAILVAVVAGAGGILSLARFAQDLGGLLEFTATTIALLWLALLGGALLWTAGRRAELSPAPTSPAIPQPAIPQPSDAVPLSARGIRRLARELPTAELNEAPLPTAGQ